MPASRFLKAGLALALFPAAALAAGPVSLKATASAKARWSESRLAQARPLPVPAAAFDGRIGALQDLGTEDLGTGSGKPVFAEGRAPVAGIRPDPQNRLFDPSLSVVGESEEPGSAAEPASGSAGAHFTSSRLVPVSADRAYPYTTVGKLFFTIPGRGDFYCTAAVLRARIVVTAGGCVHSGNNSPGFYDDFLFVPAYRDGVAPFGSWEWEFVSVSSTWASGNGKVPNGADYGMIEVADQPIDGRVRKIGDVVGYIGYQTLRLRPNHAHLLGYSSTFDNGEKLHQVTAQASRAASQANAEYGSDLRAGSSGGPIIMDFGDNAAAVRLIGVLSYFNASTKVQGASTPDARFTTLLNSVCAHRAGNC